MSGRFRSFSFVDRITRLAGGDLVVCGTFTAPGDVPATATERCTTASPIAGSEK